MTMDEQHTEAETNIHGALTVGAVAARLGVSQDTVRAHIRAGRLRAMNLAGGGGGPKHRPLWRIEPDELDRFKRDCRTTAEPRAVRSRGRTELRRRRQEKKTRKTTSAPARKRASRARGS